MIQDHTETIPVTGEDVDLDALQAALAAYEESLAAYNAAVGTAEASSLEEEVVTEEEASVDGATAAALDAAKDETVTEEAGSLGVLEAELEEYVIEELTETLTVTAWSIKTFSLISKAVFSNCGIMAGNA